MGAAEPPQHTEGQNHKTRLFDYITGHHTNTQPKRFVATATVCFDFISFRERTLHCIHTMSLSISLLSLPSDRLMPKGTVEKKKKRVKPPHAHDLFF